MSVVPGTVTQVEPALLVRIDGLDFEGQPCQAVAPAAVGDQGGVLRSEGTRVWIGRYGTQDDALQASQEARQVAERVQSAQDAGNMTHEELEEVAERLRGVDDRVETIVDEVNDAVLAAAAATGFDVHPEWLPMPTTRHDGTPLRRGDGLYLIDADDRITGVYIFNEGTGAWVEFAFAAQHIMAAGSITGNLIAAESEILSPVITGGVITGALLRSGSSGRRVEILSSQIQTYETDNSLGLTISGRSISFYSAGGDGTPSIDAGTTGGQSYLRVNAGVGRAAMRLQGQNITLEATGSIGIGSSASSVTIPGVVSTGRLSVTGNLSATGTLTVNGTINGTTIGRSGWSNVYLSPSNWGTLQYLILNGVVYLRGLVRRNTGTWSASYFDLGDLPAAARPSAATYLTATAFDPVQSAQVAVATDGMLQARSAGTGSPTAISLDGLSYPLG